MAAREMRISNLEIRDKLELRGFEIPTTNHPF
jgi:hypothetical protein